MATKQEPCTLGPKNHVGRPLFIPTDVFRVWMGAAQLNRYARVDGILASSYIAREARQGRPIRSNARRDYRLLDVVARARANGDEIAPSIERAASMTYDELEAKCDQMREYLRGETHRLDLELASTALTDASLLREDEIVAGAVPYLPRCGVYFLVRGGRVRYVGQSVNVDSRIREHAKREGFEFDSVAFIPCEAGALDQLESLYIHLLRPEWNGRAPGKAGMCAPLRLRDLLDMAGRRERTEQPSVAQPIPQ